MVILNLCPPGYACSRNRADTMNAIADLPDESLIDIDTVTRLIGMRRTWLYDEIKAGRFPPPLKIGTASRWRLGAVRRWLVELAAGGDR